MAQGASALSGGADFNQRLAAELALARPDVAAVPPDELQCHDLVEAALQTRTARRARLRPVLWRESAWEVASEALRADRAGWPVFKLSPPRELLADVADGTVCGHSFLTVRGVVVDPYMTLRGVPDEDVQRLGHYLLCVWGLVGAVSVGRPRGR